MTRQKDNTAVRPVLAGTWMLERLQLAGVLPSVVPKLTVIIHGDVLLAHRRV